MFSIDTSTSFGARIARQLDDELVIWLTTVAPSGTPAPTPVWFLWNDGQLLIASQPNTAKLRNIGAGARVSANFNATFYGGEVGVLTGSAVIADAGFTDEERAAYTTKYAERIANLGMSADEFHDSYSVLIRVTPDKLRGF
ncbi:PPOX class probable F420-dependent enzyme [Kribbella voronezhensis]|uniref:PPOX class probable F420-dependent enzyme n=1 Tax=Kribbella voronezhensis TaxID=2512212 RepID=A0A4R7SZL1_9ACTN|nr:TIGR03667 family PPOX class F420-dependent oxidoreductase [Kribbella voronezhensis]TDU84379.1 PPOX class probable F420-dependent enzyme [Kribbella voronezhensis]